MDCPLKIYGGGNRCDLNQEVHKVIKEESTLKICKSVEPMKPNIVHKRMNLRKCLMRPNLELTRIYPRG